MGKSDERKWWIASIDILVHPAVGGSAAGKMEYEKNINLQI